MTKDEKKEVEDMTVEELREKAKVLAEATGRSEEDILEDLMDDGFLNQSNQPKSGKDLVEQLKEAAELITTVQSISKEVESNTVLNGGDNKTEVVVETTLDGDIVDRAIASVERKAEKIRKIVVIIAPVLLLLTGGVGLDYFMGEDDGGDSSWDNDYYEVWGCTAPDAMNFNPDATDDDGSCYWDNSGGGGGPPCNSDWRWDAVTIQDFDANGEGFNNDLQIQMTFNDWNKCNRHMEGHFIVEIWDETRGFMWDQYQIDNKFHDQYTIDDHHYDLEAGDYVVTVEYHFDDSHWTGPSTLVTMEEADPVCEALIEELQVMHEDDEVEIMFNIGQNENCENFEIEIVLIPVDDNPHEDISHTHGLSGTSNYYTHTFNEVLEGDWQVEVILQSNGEEMEVELSSWIIVEHTVESCDINLYAIQLFTNDTAASVAYDLDCGFGDESGGYNVSTQFSVFENGSFDLITYQVGYHYIAGYVEDVHYLTVADFTSANVTQYDLVWLAIWEVDGESQYLEQTWLNQTFVKDEPEPATCDNLTLTSNSLVLGKDVNDNLTLEWDLTHDGPVDTSCYEQIEVSITLYQNGTYYDISDFHKNGVHNVYANGTISLDVNDVDLFGNLPKGTYEVLVKYRIGTEVSQDHFANSVVIS